MSKKALEGIKILELANFVSGPYCSKLMSDMGAEVIKIENPDRGDDARRNGPFLNDIPHLEKSGLFLYLNTNKMGITLNIKTETGKEIFKEIIKQVDALIEDNPPQMMEELGLTFQDLRDINPRLVMTSITPFGQTGPYRDYKAYNLNIAHGAGGGYMTPIGSRDYDKEPIKGPGYMDDYLCGLSAAMATLSAIFIRYATDTGQHIDISKQQALMNYDRVEIDQYTTEGKIAARVPKEVYPAGVGYVKCNNGYVIAMAMNDRQWQSLVNMMGNPEWVNDDKFKTRESREKNAKELQPLLNAELRKINKEKIYHEGQIDGAMVGMVCSIDEVVNSEQLKTRGFFVDVDHPEAGKIKHPSVPYRFSETPCGIERAAPLLGEHNEDIYCNRLGYSNEELAKLNIGGII